MGSYTSVMNDTTSTLYIKYAANHLALDVVAVVTAALGVIAAVVTGGILVLAISAPVILAALGVGGGVLSLAALVWVVSAVSNTQSDHSASQNWVHRLVGEGRGLSCCRPRRNLPLGEIDTEPHSPSRCETHERGR
jgi:hypothetical protein